MAVPYSYQNPYATGTQLYHSPEGETYDSLQSMKDAQEWQRQLAEFQAGGGVMGRTGGGGVPSGGGGGGGLASSYANAYNTARGANESRYGDIMAGYDTLQGGSKPPAQKSSRTIRSPGSMGGGNYQQFKGSGSPLGYFEWLKLMREGERKALQSGGSFGSMNASQLYPRMWGEGAFLGSPSQGGGSGVMQRPTVVQPTYAQYTPPKRGNQNY